MTDEKTTRFHFVLGGVELEISGDRCFVESMYKRIMQDIDEARRSTSVDADATRAISREAVAEAEAAPKKRARSVAGKAVTWIHRTSEMMHKIYMSSPGEVAMAPVLRAFDTSRISAIYAEQDAVRLVVPDSSPGHTLWAELTEAGRRKIAEARPGED